MLTTEETKELASDSKTSMAAARTALHSTTLSKTVFGE
jgi:hypothetical protein